MLIMLASALTFIVSAMIFFAATNFTYLADNVWAAYGLMIMACWLIFFLSVALAIIGSADRAGQLRAPASLSELVSWVLLIPQAGFAIGGLLNYQSGLDIMLALSKAHGVEARFVGDGLIVLDGVIGFGTFESLYEQYTWNDVTTIHLTSGGGLLDEAKKIALFVGDKEIAIWVSSTCESACVIIALASPEIYVAPNALFGLFRRERWAVVPPRPLPLPGLPTGMTTIITNAYGNSCAYLQIRRTCAAGCAIGPWDGAYSGAFSRVM
jgi:hypothetical protein